MYTEEQAKTKWCPMGRIPVWNDEHGNIFPSPVSGTHDSLCRASNCMMWRWKIEPRKQYTDKTIHLPTCKEKRPREYDLDLYSDDDECYYCGVKSIFETKDIPGMGYCGLGGGRSF